ncbi:enolase C-terminal domain-like protein [Streptomyces sp. NPDC059740]|uniref:enolase C-terminal domain-like protein n=1 Tax=Streptomyces sp. NPDC059740 TaxID=3346926 RepID=UPI0036667469
MEEISAEAYTVPTDAPEGDATLAWQSTTLVLVRARSGPATGIGWTYGAGAAVTVVRDLLAPLVTGHPADDVPGANAAMARAVRNAGRPGLVAGALSAVDIALWDLKARLHDLPLVTLLGAARPDVPVYGSGGFTPYDDTRLTEQLRHWAEKQAIGRVKIKIGEEWGRRVARDLHRVRLARSVVGDDCELYVDANGGYDVKGAIRVGRALADEGVTWFEEPVTSDDLAGLRLVREQVPVAVTAGEYGYDLGYFQRMAASGAVDCLQADVTRCGGITVWLKAAAVAESLHLDVSAHCAPHVHAHACAAAPNLRHLEWFHDHVAIEELLFEGTLDPAGGSVVPGASGLPGLGLRFREEVAERYRSG